MKTKNFFIVFIFYIFFCCQTQATEIFTSQEYHFLSGYDALLNKSYIVCATEMESIKDSIHSMPIAFQKRTLLYMTYCNERLGYRKYAASILNRIENSNLSQSDQLLLKNLKNSLKEELDDINQIHVWFFPYSGYISYNPQLTYHSARIYGAYGGLTYQGWGLSAGVENLTLNLTPTPIPYSQLMWNITLNEPLGDAWSLREYWTQIKASGTALNSGNILGLGITYTPASSTSLEFDFNGSSYPGLSIGPITVLETTVGLRQTLMSTSGFSLEIYLASETIVPQSQKQVDPISGFTLQSFYERGSLSLRAYLSSLQFGINGWYGNEVFGVRNQGALVYNALQTFEYGYGGYSQWDLFSGLGFKISIAKEAFSNTQQKMVSTTYLGGLFVNF